MSASIALLRRSREAREAIEDAVPILDGFDVAFVIHDLAGLDTEEHAEDCDGCAMLAELAAESPVLAAGCAACGCPCTSGPACSCTCCCAYEPA